MFTHNHPSTGLQQAVQAVNDILLMEHSAKDTNADDFIEGAIVPSSLLLQNPVALERRREVLDLGLTWHDPVFVAQAGLLRSLSQRAVHADSGLDAIDCLDIVGLSEAVQLVSCSRANIQDGSVALV